MAPFPEAEIMTIKRLEVALRKMDFKLLKDGAYKLHEKYHGGHRFEYLDLLQDILVEILNNTAGSLLTSDKDTQLLRASGMKYSVRNDKEYFLNGGSQPIESVEINGQNVDVKNPNENKKVRVVFNSYLFSMPRTKDIMAKYQENAVTVGREQEIFTNYLQNKKEIDCTNPEERIKLSTTYSSWNEIEATRAEVMEKLGK